MIGSYPKVYAVGHAAIRDLFTGPVVVEEKVDGSQFSFGVIDGELQARSKNHQLVLDAPEKMFTKAIETIRELEPLLTPGWVYRCEYLQRPRHNVLTYGRVPEKHLIVYDVMIGLEDYLPPAEKRREAERIGLECVPVLCQGVIESLDQLKALLDTPSILGGAKVEGVVVKNYSLITDEKKIAIGKFVSEAFKEINAKNWRVCNPSSKDIVEQLIDRYRTEARWQKAVQHLREAGKLEFSPRDIAAIIKEVQKDTVEECEEEMRELLYKHFSPKITRGIIAGLPEWYKDRLAAQAFE